MALDGSQPGVTLHRFFLPGSSFHDGDVEFPADISHQIMRVLRLRPGDRVVALDGTGNEAVVLLQDVGTCVRGSVEDKQPNVSEPTTRITLYQGLVKGPKLELVLQKCTEVGVASFVPIHTVRSVPSDISPGRLQRFHAIVREAAEQSQRGLLPDIQPPASLADALLHASTSGPIVFLWEDEPERHFHNLRLTGRQAASLFVGPEGGFTVQEVDAARAYDAEVVTLGRRILRAETAAIVGTALLLAACGDLG